MTSFKITENFDTIAIMFKTAISKGKRFPKVTLETVTGRKVVLGMAGAKSRTPGAIQVTDGGRFGDNTWFGRIETTGTWIGSRDCREDVVDLLVKFAANPLAVAQSYGLATGSCCFCQRHLSDARSVMQGYGPICAANHGLEWGDRPNPTIKEAELDDDDRTDAEWEELYRDREAERSYDESPEWSDRFRMESPVEVAAVAAAANEGCWTDWV